MTEEQAERMMNLLIEISGKLTDISSQISSDFEVETVCGKLDTAISTLNSIESNTAV